MTRNSLDVVRTGRSIWLALALAPMLIGCEAITDMDKPIPPTNLLWTKSGISKEAKNLEMRRCGELFSKASEAGRWDTFDLCMLQKGFKFVPRPAGWPNICLLQTFENGIACRSARGEYTVTPRQQ